MCSASADDLALSTAVARAQDGNEAAFLVLYSSVQPGLHAYLRGLLGEGAEEVAAAVRREIARGLPRFRGDGHIPAVIALARRRVDVLWALLRDDRPFTISPPARTPAATAACLGH